MLVELAAANAAFAVIKEAVNNAGDIAAAGQRLFDYFDAKAAIQRRYEEGAKKAQGSDLEEFMALEQLKKQEEELKQMMVYNGRPGMWQDWLKFQVEAKKKREAEKKAALLKAAKRKAAIIATFMWTALVAAIGALVIVIAWIIFMIRERS